VAVISSGAKSILDVPATREVMDTTGVPVIGYGEAETPAVFSRSSGLPVEMTAETPAQVAAIIRAHHRLQLQSGLLVTVPVPEADAFAEDEAEAAIAQATQEADEQGIHGPAATPFWAAWP
jgi:pseudouridine-5'-phosphate glycosidase